MRTLIFKRTHNGDPDSGLWGVKDCMGSVRCWEYEAVIGIGGKGTDAISQEIDLAGLHARRTLIYHVSCPETGSQ
jgi:hypothetical protein